jgi:hypothetical protein
MISMTKKKDFHDDMDDDASETRHRHQDLNDVDTRHHRHNDGDPPDVNNDSKRSSPDTHNHIQPDFGNTITTDSL